MAREPIRKVVPVIFMCLSSPPSLSMVRVPVLRMTIPAPMNSRDLKME